MSLDGFADFGAGLVNQARVVGEVNMALHVGRGGAAIKPAKVLESFGLPAHLFREFLPGQRLGSALVVKESTGRYLPEPLINGVSVLPDKHYLPIRGARHDPDRSLRFEIGKIELVLPTDLHPVPSEAEHVAKKRIIREQSPPTGGLAVRFVLAHPSPFDPCQGETIMRARTAVFIGGGKARLE
jgi:hypothetical protein